MAPRNDTEKLDLILRILQGDGTPDNLGLTGRIHDIEGKTLRHSTVLFGPPPAYKDGLLDEHERIQNMGGCNQGEKMDTISKQVRSAATRGKYALAATSAVIAATLLIAAWQWDLAGKMADIAKRLEAVATAVDAGKPK